MIILTCANGEQAKTDKGKIFKNFSFKDVIQATSDKAEKFGYRTVIYDLGSLGIGTPYFVDDKSFIEKGYYEKEVVVGYKSKSLFKPNIVKQCMENYDETIVYLDGDAQLLDRIDEIDTDEYDIGVTLRDKSELESEWHKAHIEIVRYVNAGVIFFRPTNAAKTFVNNWMQLTNEVGNDQMALNKLACPGDYPDVNSVRNVNGVRIKYFSGRKYNFYYFTSGLDSNIKVLHFKGAVRHFYPFNWKKRLYCKAAIPVINAIKLTIGK